MKNVTFRNGNLKMAGNLYLPADFKENKKYATIVCVDTAGVKEIG